MPHQLGVEPALDRLDHAIADLELDRVDHEAL